MIFKSLKCLKLASEQQQLSDQLRRLAHKNGWDFSVDSGLDTLKLDRQISTFDLNLTPWQRFYLFRPIYILNMAVLLGFMVWSLI